MATSSDTQSTPVKKTERTNILTAGDICSALKDCSNEKDTTIMNIIRMDVVGQCIMHVWYDREKMWMLSGMVV